MFCPQCSTEAPSGQPYCRVCGANLKVIGKAVTLSEAVARSDRGPLPKLKEIAKKLNAEHGGENVSSAMDQMNLEMLRSSAEVAKERAREKAKRWRREKTPAERRERLRVKGTIQIFSGTGFALFLYFLTHAMRLHLPPDVISQIPFDVDPVMRVLWVGGLIPVLGGIGRWLASIAIHDKPQTTQTPQPIESSAAANTEHGLYQSPLSVTERTTNLLESGKS